MFSISTFKSRIIDSNNVLKLIEDKDKHEFDLLNENYYDSDGNLIESAPDPDIRYREKFLRLLRDNKYQIVRILDYHYTKTEDKELFYNYVKVDLSNNLSLDYGIIVGIKEWLDNIIKSPKVVQKEEVEVLIKEIPNDIIRSTIDDYLIEYKDSNGIDDKNYEILSTILIDYFKNGFFKDSLPQIIVRKVGIKKFAWVLYSLFKELNDDNLDINYLKFAKCHISLFKNVKFNENNKKKCNMYKYFTTKPK
jgi:hypothetical protein